MDTDPEHPRSSPHTNEEKSVLKIFNNLEADGVHRPALWRQIIPWLFTAVILWWIFKDINFEDFIAKLSHAQVHLLLPAMFGYTAVYAICDILSFGVCCRWFVSPDLTVREMINVRWGCYLFMVLYAPLMAVSNIAYFLRHKGAPATWTISGLGFAALNDMFVFNAVMTFVLILNTIFKFAPELESFWLFPMVFPWLIAYVHFRYWFTDSKDRYGLRFSQHPIMRSARLGQTHHFLKIYLTRFTSILTGIIAHVIALRAFSIDVPLPVIAIVAPLIIGGAFLPISGGGFGGPQLVALILLPYVNGDKTLLVAYSISFSVCFTLGRSIIGAIFFPSYLRDLRDAVPRLVTDPLTGESLEAN